MVAYPPNSIIAQPFVQFTWSFLTNQIEKNTVGVRNESRAIIIYFNNKFNNLFKDQSTNEKVSFKELSAWGVFRPLAVDAALINGKVIKPFRLRFRNS